MNERLNKALYLALALLMAVVLWLYVDDLLDNTITRDIYNIPIEFIGVEDTLPNRGLMLISGQDETLNLTISGPRATVSNMDANDILVQAYLNNINAVGTYPLTFDISYRDDINESEISIERQSRSTVTVQVGTMYSRNIPVEISVVGEVADGYIYMADLLTADPSTLTLSGMAEDVDRVASARIVVDLTDANATIQRPFDYELLDADDNVLEAENVRASSSQVEVTAPVYITKELPLTVRIKEAPGSLEEYVQTRLDVKTITMAGDPASLETLDEIVLGEVDLSTLLTSDDIPFDIVVPAGCVNISGVNTVTYHVQFRRALDVETFSVTNISATGLSQGQHFDPMTSSVDVQVRGPVGSLADLTADDIRIVVSVYDIVNDGTYSLPAMVYVDGNDRVGAVGTYSVACKITS